MADETAIVLATGNPKKLREMREIMSPIGIEIIALSDLELDLEEPEETGDTFEDNARLKAMSYAEQTGRLCLADDSGLEVDALGGAPGVKSARYSLDLDASDLAREERDRLNNQKLMDALGDRELADRQGRFVCAMCLAGPAAVSERLTFIGGGGFQPPLNHLPAHQQGISRARDLPHWYLEGATYFVTFRTAGSLMNDAERQIVLEACLHHHGVSSIFHAITVMPDHVHMVFRMHSGTTAEAKSPSTLLHSIKSYSANAINRERQTQGQFWQRESFDRIMRSLCETLEAIRYTELNPVRNNLVSQPGEYPWTMSEVELRRRLEASAPTLQNDAVTRKNVLVLAESRGTFEGAIGLPGDVPRGANGFGYDPLFLVAPEYITTSAELDPETKHTLSHRGAAARIMMEHIRTLNLGSSH